MTKKSNLLDKRNNSVWAAVLALMTAQSLPIGALAAGTTPTSAAGNSIRTSSTAPSGSSSLKGQLNLNLSSANSNVQAAKAGTIIVGGHIGARGNITGGTPFNVGIGQAITPAQNAALWQAISGGGQHLLVNSAGVAVGGVDKVSSAWAGNLSSLVVPKGVAVDAIGFNAAHPLNVAGASNISGALYALQTSPGLSSVLNFANDLTIGAGGILSGSLPTNQQNLSGLYASRNVNLNVAGNLTNNGSVSAPGTLNLNVGGTLSNVTSTTGGAPATITAANLNIISGTGNIVNSGLMSATAGSLNVNTMDPKTDLTINNTGGVIEALGSNGTLNLRENGPDIESASVSVWGGTLRADSSVNMYGKDMIAAVDRIDSTINNTGSTAHVAVNGGNLDLGNQILSGDPVYYNNAGNLQIGDLTTVGGDLVMVASGNITTLNNPATISTTAANSNIFIGAGLTFTGGANNATTFANNAAGFFDTLNTFGAGVGSINTVGNPLNLTTSGTGNITLVASGGSVNIGNGSISTASGNVLWDPLESTCRHASLSIL